MLKSRLFPEAHDYQQSTQHLYEWVEGCVICVPYIYIQTFSQHVYLVNSNMMRFVVTKFLITEMVSNINPKRNKFEMKTFNKDKPISDDAMGVG